LYCLPRWKHKCRWSDAVMHVRCEHIRAYSHRDDRSLLALPNKQRCAYTGLYSVHLQRRPLPCPERNCCDDDGLRGLPSGNLLCRRRIFLHRLRVWLLHGHDIDRRDELHSMRCRHV